MKHIELYILYDIICIDIICIDIICIDIDIFYGKCKMGKMYEKYG